MIGLSTPDQANRYHSYLSGWRDGSARCAMDDKFVKHPKYHAEYLDGYKDGQAAFHEACQAASRMSGYVPSILRLAGDSDHLP